MDDEKGTALKAPYTEATSYDAAYDLTEQIPAEIVYDEDGQTYVLDSIKGEVQGTVKENVEITAVYSLDANEDGTPDKYEATVTYQVVNGTFEGEENTTVSQTYVLAEQNTDGTWTAKDKTLSDIPVPKANEGYEGGSWTPTEPTEETKVEDGAK
ncbi:hypothetical protein H6A32_15830, partial [Drancourtella massiliensis]